MTKNAAADQEMTAIMSAMRIGDHLEITNSGSSTDACATLHRGTPQPFEIKRVRAGRELPHNIAGTAPYTPAQLGQLYYSDTRVLSICAECGNTETVLPDQLIYLAGLHHGKKAAIAFGCNKCHALNSVLLVWTALAESQALNDRLAPLYDSRSKEPNNTLA